MEITEHWGHCSLITRQISSVGFPYVVSLTYSPDLYLPFRSTIGLDPLLYYYLPRLIWRTLMRLLGLRSPCAVGCKETWGEVFSSEGIIWFCVTNHPVARTKYKGWISRMSVGDGGKMIRLDESRGELDRWKDDLEWHIRQM